MSFRRGLTAFSIVTLTVSAVCAYEFVPGVEIVPEGTASRSKIIWAADGAASAGVVSYYRRQFTLNEKPAKAFLASYLDDGGAMYVNGEEVPRFGDVSERLVAGTNTIAVRLTNLWGESALMFQLSFTDAKGGRSYLHSDGEVKGTVRPQEPGWDRPDFDDSAWLPVKVRGDVLARPWSLWTDLRRNFTTPEEYARLKQAEAAQRTLPEGLADEPDPVAKVVYRGSRPFIEINGTLHEPLVNICSPGDPYRDSALIRCAEAGFGIVQLNLGMEQFLRDDGADCDFADAEAAVQRLLHLNPDAYLILGLRFGMISWAKRHPEEQVGYGTGPADEQSFDDYRGRPIRPSAASDRYRELSLRVLRDFAAFAKGRPWAKRVIGIRPMGGVYGEWHQYGMFEAPDTGVRMQEKFRAHMKAKRGLEDVRIPTPEMRRHAGGDLLDPAEDHLVLDFFEFHANVTVDLLLALADEAKRQFPGRLVGAYYGYLFTSDSPEGTTVLLDRVLSSPSIDFLSNPPYYSAYSRLSGGSYSPRTIPATFHRHGKLLMLEDDSRFHHVYDWIANSGQAYATKTPRETEMNMRRNWLNQFFDGDGIQFIDPMEHIGERPYAFDDPAVFKAIAESKAALAKAGDRAEASGNDVAVVLSPRERLRQDGGVGSSFTRRLYRQSFLDLARSGMAYDLLTLEDFLTTAQDYRIVMFLNAFSLTESERETLKKRLRKSGMTAIWIGPAGGVTEKGFDDAAMSELTGVTATGVARRPRVVCRDAAARAACGGKVFVKTLADGAKSMLVPEPPNAPTEYADLLAEAGAWRYVQPGHYFRRHGDVFMFHTGTAGEYTIRLPDQNVKVRELFSGTEAAGSEVTLAGDGPGTLLFKIERR